MSEKDMRDDELLDAIFEDDAGDDQQAEAAGDTQADAGAAGEAADDQGAEQVEASDQASADRDEKGRFKAKGKEGDGEPEAQAEGEAEAAAGDQKGDAAQPAIPAWRLSEVTQERNQYRDQLQERDRQMAAMQAELRQLKQQLAPPEQKPAPELWDDPDAYVGHAVQQHINQAVQPLVQALHANAKMVAEAQYSAEEVEAAGKSLLEAAQAGQVDQATLNRVLSSPNRYVAAVNWHREAQALKEVGGDINAYNQRFQERLLDDPAFLKKVAERLRAGSGGQQGGRAPNVDLPPSLTRVADAGGPASGAFVDQSDGDLLDSILPR